jgi:hypothetical protein
MGNKGLEAALTAVEMAVLKTVVGKKPVVGRRSSAVGKKPGADKSARGGPSNKAGNPIRKKRSQ